jgi:hypothetical protein
MKRSKILLLLVALSGLAMAGAPGRVAVQTAITVPEMNPGTALSALTLLSGALVVVRGRRKRSSS